jgi:hypothetical protein
MPKLTEAALANRRRSQRRKPRSTVKIECRKGSYGLGSNVADSVLDISDSGVRMVVSQPLEMLAEVEIIINGYGMRASIKRISMVRWVLKLENGMYCVGIEFQKPISYRDWQNLAAPS